MGSEWGSPLLFAAGHLSVRALQRSDLVLLARWLANPEVAVHYGGRDVVRDEAAIAEEFLLPEGATTGEARGLVVVDEVPVGYVQVYPVEPDELAEYGYAANARLWGMDLFLGEPGRWNRGIGTELVRATVAYLSVRHHPQAVVIDPQVANLRAVRCYEKAGFERVRLLPGHEWHEGAWCDCWLMVWRPPSARGSRDSES
jgi:aminoglycoside 6'-N-acetyltransferase